jgi:hypothetical protein
MQHVVALRREAGVKERGDGDDDHVVVLANVLEVVQHLDGRRPQNGRLRVGARGRP